MSEEIPESSSANYNYNIEILVDDKGWYDLEFDFQNHIEKVALITLIKGDRNATSKTPKDISFLLADDEKLHQLNLNYADKNKATNVLAFRYDHADDANYQYLGDIAISYQKLMSESLEFNKSIKEHLTHLVIHGVLHLLGLDHIKQNERIKMENLEIKIMAEFGYDNPYLLK